MAVAEFSRSLPMLLYRALDAVMPRFRSVFNDFGITEQQWRILRVLMDESGLALRDLAAVVVIAPPSLVGIVDRLESAGLVARERTSNDRRRITIRVTERGRALQAEIAPRVAEAYADLMKCLPPREWIGLVNGLQSLADNAAKAKRSRQV